MGGFESIDWGPYVVQTLFATLLGGSFAGAYLKMRLDRRFQQEKSTRDWKEQALSDLVGPAVMHLERTGLVAERYRETSHFLEGDSYFDAMLMRDSNVELRGILLSKGHLIPEELRPHANTLVGHYDLWLRRFDAKVEKDQPTADSIFDVGLAEIEFPTASVDAFKSCYLQMREELYGVKPG